MSIKKLTVDDFSRIYAKWIRDSDRDDIQKLVAEFYGVPVESVSISDEDEISFVEAQD